MKRRSTLRSKNRSHTQVSVLGVPAILQGSGAKIGLVLICGVLVLFSLIKPTGLGGVRMGVSDAFSPVLTAISAPIVDMAETVRNFSGLSDLQAENARLMQENRRLKEWYQTALLVESENKSLRDLLRVKVEPHYKTISARVLSDSGNAFAKSMLVSAGRSDGVQTGQAVMAGDGLVGRIIEVGKNTSRVLLISDINSRVPILVDDTRQHAIMAGHNEYGAYLIHLPIDSDVNDGARIVTSGHGGMFPYGLPVGRVVKQAPNQAQDQAQAQAGSSVIRVEPFTRFDRIVHVRIIDKGEGASQTLDARP